MKKVDISGNFYLGDTFKNGLQVHEPENYRERPNIFHQELPLKAGTYQLEFYYDILLDREKGLAIGNHYDHFCGFAIDGEAIMLSFALQEESNRLYRACTKFDLPTDKTVRLSLSLYASRVIRVLLCSEREDFWSGKQVFSAVTPQSDGQAALIRGIPFLLRKCTHYHNPAFFRHGRYPNLDRGNLAAPGNEAVYDIGGARVDEAYFLGMHHDYDLANGSWYSPKGDEGYSHFIGDQAGQLEIDCEDGQQLTIPLIFGFNLWYVKAWDMIWHNCVYEEGVGGENRDAALFSGDESAKTLLQDNISLVDGMRLMGSNTHNARYIFCLSLEGKRVRRIRVVADPAFYGFPIVSAITLQTRDKKIDALTPLSFGNPYVSHITPTRMEFIKEKKYMGQTEKIKKLLYDFVLENPILKIPMIPKNYFGPHYDFCGCNEAIIAATYLYHNGPECAAYIADSGTGCMSSTQNKSVMNYTQGTGIWIKGGSLHSNHKDKNIDYSLSQWFLDYKQKSPGEWPGVGNAWSRGVGQLLREAAVFGYDKFIKSYINWLDHALLTEANPPHFNRVVGEPKFMRQIRTVGQTIEEGVRENDGHGICMMGRAVAWYYLGYPLDFNREHFAVTKAAVDWLSWQLQTDTLFPGARKDVLFTESECVHGGSDIFSTYNCVFGLKLSIRMAEQLGEKPLASKWGELYKRLIQGILDHLTVDSPFGQVFRKVESTDWQDYCHIIPFITLAPDGDSYLPLEKYSVQDEMHKKLLEISQNTYQMLLSNGNYNNLRMFGYGQGMMTQTALLLDEMENCERLLHLMLRCCYLKNLGGYISPEGIILHKSGEFYTPVNGYMGQDSHVADSTKAVRLLLGIDDNDSNILHLVPRMPHAWDKMRICDYPVMIKNKREKISYLFEKEHNEIRFSYQLSTPAHQVKIRLGALPKGAIVKKVFFSKNPIGFEQKTSGDSDWVYLDTLAEQMQADLRILLEQK